MSVASRRIVGLSFSGDVDISNLAYNAVENSNSPGQIQQIVLSNGNNIITCPANASGVTIVPALGNATQIVVKGTNADTGISLHLTDPSSIAIRTGVQLSVVLYVASTTANPIVRLIWT